MTVFDPNRMSIVSYPHPTLRWVSRAVRKVDGQLQQVIRRMFELMYEAKGVGLAANQVDLPLRLFVANLESCPTEGEEMVFINPVISRPKGSGEGEEGCLSLPGVYAKVTRPKRVRINAYDLSGQELSVDAEGMLARVVQHETDHLDGVLFTDRLSATGKLEVEAALDELEMDYRSRASAGEFGSPDQITAHLADWEKRYC